MNMSTKEMSSSSSVGGLGGGGGGGGEQERVDALDLLRHYVGESVSDTRVYADAKAKVIVFGNGGRGGGSSTKSSGTVRLPWTTLTRFKNIKKKSYYSVGSMYFLWEVMKIKKMKYADYVRECRKHGLVFVAGLDRATVLNYLGGAISEHEKIEAPAIASSSDKTLAMGDFSTAGTSGAASGLATKTSKEDTVLSRVFHQELVMNNRCTVLLGPCNFEGLAAEVKQLFEVKEEKRKRMSTRERMAQKKKGKQEMQDRKRASSSSSARSSSSSSGAKRVKRTKKRTGHRMNPIIVVPSGSSAVLNMYNVKSLLGTEGRFVSQDDVRKAGGRKETNLTLKHTFSDGRTVTFRVVDVVNNLSSRDLRSIAVVILDGNQWEFRAPAWKKVGSNTANIFSRVKGVHFKFDNMATKNTVKEWKCDVLRLSRMQRYKDRAVRHEFWALVEGFIMRNRDDIGGVYGETLAEE
eukprot:g2067.t1